MVRGEPALDGEEQAGEQCEAAQRGNGANRNRQAPAPKWPEGERERAREDRARLANERGGEGEGEVIPVDISVGSVYLAIVPCRDSMNKQPSVRPFRDRVYSDA